MKDIVARLDEMAEGWLCNGLPDADIPREAAREIERLRAVAFAAAAAEREACALLVAEILAPPEGVRLAGIIRRQR